MGIFSNFTTKYWTTTDHVSMPLVVQKNATVAAIFFKKNGKRGTFKAYQNGEGFENEEALNESEYVRKQSKKFRVNIVQLSETRN